MDERVFKMLGTARFALDNTDYISAVQSAYYAMHASVKLYLDKRHPGSIDTIKSHSGLINRFSQLAIKSGDLPADMARDLKSIEGDRIDAVYEYAVDQETAHKAFKTAEAFCQAIAENLA